MNIFVKLYHQLPTGPKNFIRSTYTNLIRWCHTGKYHVKLNSQSSFWVSFHDLPEYREAKGFTSYEPEFFDMFCKKAKNAKVIYDVGSNIGLYALTAATLNRNAQIISFEPETQCCKMIERSKALNGYTNITVQDYCIGDENNTITLSMKGSTGHFVSHDKDETQVIAKPIYKLDHLVDSGAIPAPDLVKIDVEGYEAHVVRGMVKTIEQHRPVLLLEIHYEFMKQYGECGDSLLKNLKSLNYSITKLRDPNSSINTAHKQTHILLEPQSN